MLYFLFKGIIVGFSIAAPVGPIGILCIHRSLYQGYKWGLITGMGAATADLIYGCIAGFSLTFISGILLKYQNWIHLIGGFFLLYFGVRILLSKPVTTTNLNRLDESLLLVYLSTLVLNLTNPITILLFLSIFSAMGAVSVETNYWNTSWMALGILGGSSLWWLILSGGVAFLLRHKIKQTALKWVNRASGIIILLFASAILF